MARDRSGLYGNWSLMYGHRIGNLTTWPTFGGEVFAAPHHATTAQMRQQLTLEQATGLNEQRSVNGFMGQLHLQISMVIFS